MGSELTISRDQEGFTDAQLAALHQMGVSDRASKGDLEVFFHRVQSTGLDPFSGQIYMIERQGKQTIQTGIDGFRMIARRASERSHETFGEPETLWCGTDGKWHDVWLDPQNPPAAAKVVVERGGGRFEGVATYAEYAGRKRDGSVNGMWTSKPAVMLAKCAEAIALRKAFPLDMSKIYEFGEIPEHESASYIDATVVATKEQRRQLFDIMRGAGVGSKPEARRVIQSLTPSHVDTDDVTKIPDDDVLLLLDDKSTLASKIAYILELDKRQTSEEASDGR